MISYMNMVKCDASNIVWEINGDFFFSPLAIVTGEIRQLALNVGGSSYSAIPRTANGVAYSVACFASLNVDSHIWVD